MHLGPADLLGLPSPDLVHGLAAFRYAMVGLALVWALLVARAHPAVAVGFGLLYAAVGVGFWTLVLARPYGLLSDAVITRRLAEAAVASFAGAGEGLLADSRALGPGAWLGRWGLPPHILAIAPTLMAPFVVPAAGLLIALLWARRDLAWLAAILWLAFSTGDNDGVRGMGVVPGLWAHPIGGLGVLATLAAVLIAGRALRRPWAWMATGGVVAAAWMAAALAWVRWGEPVTELGLIDRALLLTLDQGLWLPLGVYGLVRGRDAAARALAAAGLVLLGLPWPGSEPWGPHALYRLGLILAAADPVADLCSRAGTAAMARLRSFAALPPVRVGAAAAIALLAPGSFLTWWHPVQLDAVHGESLDPVPAIVLEIGEAVRAHTPPQAVVMASPEYATSVALAGRRVLSAPGLMARDEGRWRAEERVLAGRGGDRLVQRYGVSHVLVAPGDFLDRGLARPEDLETRGGVELVFARPDGFRLYAIRPGQRGRGPLTSPDGAGKMPFSERDGSR